MESHSDIRCGATWGPPSVSFLGRWTQALEFRSSEEERKVAVTAVRRCAHEPHHVVAPEFKRAKGMLMFSGGFSPL